MDIGEVVDRLSMLDDPSYGRVYIEFGGFSDSRTVLYHEGHWCYDDSKHSNYFTCASLGEALECMVSPPSENDWEENIVKHYGPRTPGAMLGQGEHP